MSNHIGEEIYRNRKAQKLTQDQFGARFHVSGPAIFKFEKGFVQPSLKLWLEISNSFKIPERKSVLMWIKDRLPEKFQYVIDVKRQKVVEKEPEGFEEEVAPVDYATIPDKKRLRKKALEDGGLPRGLRSLLRDVEFWNVYKPSGDEINFLRDTFGRFPRATRALFREALILHRQFVGKE